jgi:hypothetical protein
MSVYFNAQRDSCHSTFRTLRSRSLAISPIFDRSLF